MKGDPNSVGWFFGPLVGPWIWTIGMACYFGMLFSLLVLPYMIVLLGIRGPKAPPWLADVLISTGRVLLHCDVCGPICIFIIFSV